jgi:hypothetical protein
MHIPDWLITNWGTYRAWKIKQVHDQNDNSRSFSEMRDGLRVVLGSNVHLERDVVFGYEVTALALQVPELAINVLLNIFFFIAEEAK